MNLLTATQTQSIAIIALLLAVVLVTALVFLVVQGRRQIAGLDTHLEELRKQLQKTQRAALAMQGQLQALRKQAGELGNRIELTASRQQDLEFRDMGSLTYDHASKLVKMGAAQDELISSCGLSPAEARLFELMHRRDAAREGSTSATS